MSSSMHSSESFRGDIPSDDARSPYDELAEVWGVPEITPLATSELDVLRGSYESGNEDDFEALLDDVTTDFLSSNNPQFAENIRAMRATRREDAQRDIRDNQRLLYEQAKGIILETAGISADASKSALDRSRDDIRERLQLAQQRDGEAYDPLGSLGMLQKDEQGQEIFVYPPGLFSSETDARWRSYLDAVKRHVAASNKFQLGLASQKDVVAADFERRMAHNAFARDLQYILGNPEDDFEEYRKLAVKMREQRFPSVETSEKSRTNLMIGASVIEAMHEHLLPSNAVYGGSDW